MGSAREEVRLRFLGSHAAVSDEPAENYGGAPRASRFAMDVNGLSARDMLLDELDGLPYVLQAWRVEIGRGDAQLLDARGGVFRDRPRILFARIDDRPHAFGGQSSDVGLEGQCAEDHMVVDAIPPVSNSEDASEQVIPEKGRPEEEPGNRTRERHGSLNEYSGEG